MVIKSRITKPGSGLFTSKTTLPDRTVKQQQQPKPEISAKDHIDYILTHAQKLSYYLINRKKNAMANFENQQKNQ